MIDIINYDKINKKYIFSLYSVVLCCFVFIIISIVNSKDDMEFYKNSKQVNCVVTNKKNKDNENIIRVSYKIKGKVQSADILVTDNEFDSIHIGDKMEIFYNFKKTNECRMTTRSVTSIIIIILILFIVMVLSLVIAIYYSIRIRTNQKLIKSNNTIDAKFYRLEFKNSLFSNERINYVYCKSTINGEKKIFKSIGFKDKPKPLNDTSTIKVYIDNKKNYLVNLFDLIQE